MPGVGGSDVEGVVYIDIEDNETESEVEAAIARRGSKQAVSSAGLSRRIQLAFSALSELR